jgi:hypothetical protein
MLHRVRTYGSITINYNIYHCKHSNQLMLTMRQTGWMKGDWQKWFIRTNEANISWPNWGSFREGSCQEYPKLVWGIWWQSKKRKVCVRITTSRGKEHIQVFSAYPNGKRALCYACMRQTIFSAFHRFSVRAPGPSRDREVRMQCHGLATQVCV